MPLVTKRAAARRDLVEQFVYLAENAGLNVAERFLSPAEASFADLARQPMMGAPVTLTQQCSSLVDNSRSSDSPQTMTAQA
jgi:toxin ParE1/3/4